MSELSEPRVEILMATYCGEKYIRKQIDSIINQTYQNWKLLVRDDGSSDQTVAILNEYASKDPRISIMLNTSDVHGWQQNFQNLIMAASDDAEYYMFCDQDDIWHQEKIRIFVDQMGALRQKYPDRILVLHADMSLMNEKDELTEESFHKIYPLALKHITDCFYSQRVYGCNMMFDSRCLKLTAQFLDGHVYRTISHDGLIMKVAAADGGIVHFLPQTTMSYRRDGGNATANHQFKTNKSKILNKLKNLEKLASDQCPAYRQSIFVINKMLESDYPYAERETLGKIKTSLEKGGFPLWKVWREIDVDCGSRVHTLSHFFVLFTKMHKKYLGRDSVQ